MHIQDPAEVEAATDACLSQGVRVLQLYRMGDEDAHVARLLDLLNPPLKAEIVDVGCGIGAMAYAMQSIRPDLGFVLVNSNAYQLSLCPPDMAQVQADMHAIPIADGTVDVVMVCYTLGYGDVAQFFAEAFRMLKPGGILFIYDLARHAFTALPCPLMQQYFHYQVYCVTVIDNMAQAAGFATDAVHLLRGTHTHLDGMLDDTYRAVFEQLDAAVIPVAYRYVKPL